MNNFRMPQSEFIRFLLVGGTTVLIDFVVYFFILYIVGLETEMSKGVGFSTGTLFSYFANKNFTFNSSLKGPSVFLLFVTLYFTTLIVNIGVNELSLLFFGRSVAGISLSLLIATVFSALLNYIGMKYVVFKGQTIE